MSEYVGEAFVKILPDARGFSSSLDREIASMNPGTQALLKRSGLDKSLKSYDATARASIATNNALAAAEAAAAVQTEKLGKAHENVAIHAHRSQIAGFTIRGTTLGLGAAAVVGAEGLRKLSEGLKVVGEEADTTTGRLKNAAAAALTGDFATAAQKLGEQAAFDISPGARVASQAASAAVAADKQRQDAIALAKNLLELREKTAKAEGQIGTAAGVTRFELEKQLRLANLQYGALSPNLKRIAAGQFGLAPDLSNKARIAPTDTSRASGFGLDSQRAAQTKTLADDRKLFSGREDFLRKQISYLENAGAHSAAAKDRLSTLYGQLDAVEGQIQSLDDQAAAKRAERLRNRLALQQTTLQIQAANARTDAQENAATRADAAAARTNAQNKNLDAQTRAGYLLQAAQDDKTIFENEKAAAEAAAAERKRLADEAKRKRDEAIAAEKQRREEERQQYRDDISLAEQKLSLNVQRAQLTDKNLNDDRKAIKAQIAFYRTQARDFKLTDAERLNFRSQAVAAQLSLKSLNSGNQAPRSSASDFFNEAASQFRSFGSNIATKGGILSGQDARGAFAARALGSGNIAQVIAQQAAQQRTNLLAESTKQTGYLKMIATRLTYGGATGDPPAKAIGKARRGAHIVGSNA